MTVITDYTTHLESQQFERELFDRLERRRQIADRASGQLGSRLAFAAYLARRARTQSSSSR